MRPYESSMNRRTVLRVLAAFACAAMPMLVCAQAWPERPIKFLMTAPAGSSIDMVGRTIADKLGARLGQPVIVENKPAASGTVAVAEAARAAPDGYTMVLGYPGPRRVRAADPEAAVRRAEGSRAADHHDQPAQRSGRERATAGEDAVRADRLRQGQPGQAQLCVGRQRQLVASGDGVPQGHRRLRRRSRSVQRLAACRHRHDPERDADDVRGDGAAAGADPGRQAARRSPSPPPSGLRCCPTCRRSPNRAFPVSTRRPGTAYCFPQARRSRSSRA